MAAVGVEGEVEEEGGVGPDTEPAPSASHSHLLVFFSIVFVAYFTSVCFFASASSRSHLLLYLSMGYRCGLLWDGRHWLRAGWWPLVPRSDRRPHLLTFTTSPSLLPLPPS